MKTNKCIVRIVLISIIMMLVFCQENVFAAASVKAAAGKTSLNVGDTTSLSVTASGCAGVFSITSSDNSVVSVSSASSFVEGSSMETPITLTAKGAGTATITIRASDVTETDLDADGNPVNFSGSTSVKITVTDPNANNNDNNNNTNTQKPEQPSEKDPDPVPAPQPQTPKEPTFKNVNETVYVQTESVNVRGTWSANGGQYGSLKKGDSVTRTGVSSEKINGYVWSRINYNGKTAYVISSALTTTKVEVEEEPEEEESTNKLLKELKIEGYELSPKFDPQTTKYSLTLKELGETEEVEDSLEITATPEDEKAKVEITGNENFKVGNNIVKITVTAEDGTARIYTITVSKTNEEGVVESLKLSTLEISNGTLEPSFDPEITNYVITVEDLSTITAATILATVDDKNITITTSETSVDENGEKIITLMLESQKDEKTGIYQITVKKPVVNQAAPTITGSSDNTIYYILGGIIGALLLLIIIIIIALKKTADKDNEDAIDADELDDDYDYNLKGAIDEANKSYDDMVEESNFKSQILNTDFSNIETSKTSEKTRILNDFDNIDDDDFKPNVAPKKKGKHF